MALFKCKMCGGTLEVNNHESVGVCEYCGTQQTLPRLDDYKKSNLYDRANHFRRNNEFDKAMQIYEQILNEDGEDAEAYWSIVLCRYGIEYVEDPDSHKRIPTVNRAQFTSIFDDDNYKSALQYADGSQRIIYEEEADAINEIQKGILSISQQEEPFDVFICYKEADDSGRRTPDSVLANELYHELTEEGFKVFFSRITLEGKIGSAYEPYIFAALNSAKVMVALGTKPEYFQAPWVKNEWSRYLALIKNGEKKTLIPAYKDMDPYDLPVEFSHLQAQDMSKLGFMQDIIRGIGKITEVDEPRQTVVRETGAAGAGGNIVPLLKRVFIFLEDGDWESADEYCEKVLDIDPETAQAYVGKLMAKLHVRKQEDLADCKEPFSDDSSFQKAVRFGDDALRNTLKNYNEHICVRNEKARLEAAYAKAVDKMNFAHTEKAYQDAAAEFLLIEEYKDAAALRDRCLEEAENCRKDAVYDFAKGKIDGLAVTKGEYEQAIRKFQAIPGWRDAEDQIEICKRKIEEIEYEEEARRIESEKQTRKKARRRKSAAIVTAAAICAGIAAYFIVNNVIIPDGKYEAAMALIDEGDYEEAYEQLMALEGYKDSGEKAKELKNLNIPDKKYEDAVALIDEGNYEEAYERLAALEGYKDSSEKAESIRWEYDMAKTKKAEVGDEIRFGSYEQDNDSSNGKEAIEWVVLAKEDSRILVISKYVLERRPYHKKDKAVTWKSCSLRKWLNKTFIKKAFSDDEKALIPVVKVNTEKLKEDANSKNRVSAKPTKDRIFLLSIAEAEKYFSSNEKRQCKVLYPALGPYSCRWMLRSPGEEEDYVAIVNYGGSIDEHGRKVENNAFIRPAMWIDLSSLEP